MHKIHDGARGFRCAGPGYNDFFTKNLRQRDRLSLCRNLRCARAFNDLFEALVRLGSIVQRGARSLRDSE